MNREDLKEYFNVLELSPDASLSEIRKAYHFLKDLYSSESIASLPLRDEISAERNDEILQQIEKAYQSLLVLFDRGGGIAGKSKGSEPLDRELKEMISSISIYNGETLRTIRKKLNIDLQDISLHTKIQIRYLRSIESEEFDELPPGAYTRGFVVNYAKYLSLDPAKVAEDYMDRYNEWKQDSRD